MDIEHVALLARLRLSEDEKRLFSTQVDGIINYIDTLNELDTADIEPTAHVFAMSNVFREDKLKPSLSQEEALLNAPGSSSEFYRVPKIIE